MSKRLIRKRGGLKAIVTTQLECIKAELAKEDPDIEVLQDILNKFKPRKEEILRLDEEIESNIDEDDDEGFQAEFNTNQIYRDKMLSGEGSAERKIQEKQVIQPQELQATEDNGSDNEADGSQCSRNSNRTNRDKPSVRLPMLEIRKFRGDHTDWSRFWSHFKGTIHNSVLDNADKLNYLLSYLDGDAATAVAGMPFNADAYDSVIEILMKRFGHTASIIDSHMRAITRLAPVRDSSDITALRKLYDACEVQIRSLGSLGQSNTQGSGLLGHVILGLIPEEIALAYHRNNTTSSVVQIENLLDFLQKEISCRERTFASTRADLQHRQPRDRHSRDRSSTSHRTVQPTVSSAAALYANVQNKSENPCIFCNEKTHWSNSCTNLSVAERKDIAVKKRCCFICLRTNHQAKDCRAKKKHCKHCSKRHNTALCDSSTKVKDQSKIMEKPSKVDVEDVTIGIVQSSVKDIRRKGAVLLQTAEAIATNDLGNKIARVRCLLDTGSQQSFIKEDLSRRLQLPIIREESINVHPFGSKRPIQAKRNRVRLELQNRRDQNRKIVLEVLETPEVCGALFMVPDKDVICQMEARGLILADVPVPFERDSASRLDVLIGSDYYWDVVSGKIERLEDSLVAMETTFDWTVQGPTSLVSSAIGINTLAVISIGNTTTQDDLLSNELRRFWELEAIGISEAETNTPDEGVVLQEFEKNITFQNGRYETSFPWKPNKHELCDNYSVAYRRTTDLLHRLKSNPDILRNYNQVLRDQLNQGIIEKVDPQSQGDAVYYLPHRAVIKESSETTKLRIVFDASSHSRNKSSLNDCLEVGPNLNPELMDVLLRFRERRVAFTGDLEKAFLQISITEQDRDFLRFIWIDVNQEECPDPSGFCVYRNTRATFGVKASPFILAATVRYHVQKYEAVNPSVCQLIKDSLYVDDLVAGGDNVKESFAICSDVLKIFQEYSMKMRKWKTNSPQLRKLLRDECSPDCKADEDLSDPLPVKVLGLFWDTSNDCLLYDTSSLVKSIIGRSKTKRAVLKAVARIFDPLRLISPFIVRAKILFQQLWEKGISWDEALPQDLASQFDLWSEELRNLRLIKIPRFYFLDAGSRSIENIQLHCFVDASEKAYAAIAYLRYQDNAGMIGSTLVAAKSRVAPLKKLTLPRLELMGAVLGARLVTHLKTTFCIVPSSVQLWTDSTISLHWIKGSSMLWKPFVSNRVREIQSLTNPESWNHCKGKENPSDWPTRGKTLKELASSDFWWHGPSWLSQDFRAQLNTMSEVNPCPDMEVLKDERKLPSRDVIQVLNGVQSPKEPLLDLKGCSSLLRIYRTTAWVWRFVNNARKSKCRNGAEELTAEEILNAERYWVQQIQEEEFPVEVSSLSENE